ncbi:MAG: hypothetical protein MUO52_01595, partial [Desulfobacterales bacterium]|nr:hypothetical protein [Desulfobacterales bacterium]
SRALTNRSVDKPAKSPGLELPGRTLFFAFRRTFLDHPTRLYFLSSLVAYEEQEKDLSLHMGGNPTPSLFITVYSLH